MAFKFFRRRQKTVVIIMVALMVSFLLGFKGLSMLFSQNAGNPETGRLADGRVLRAQDYRNAYSDMQLLTQTTKVGTRVFRYITGSENQAAGVYALLLAEAEASGPVSEEDIDLFLRSFLAEATGNGDDEALRNLYATVRSRGVSSGTFRAAVGRMIRIYGAYRETLLRARPSMPRVRRLFADLTEKVAIRVAIVPAESFLDACEEPTAFDVDAQFETYREATPGLLGAAEQFAFGYRLPRRVRLQYMILDAERIGRIVVANDADARNYYIEHRNDFDFLKALGISEEQAAELSKPQPKFSEVRQAIAARLAVQDVQAKMRSCLSVVEEHLEDFRGALPAGGGADARPYDYVVQQLVVPADAFLARPIAAVAIDGKPLAEAMTLLAEAAGLTAVAFPYGDYDGRLIDATTPVQLNLSESTLAEALALLCGQLSVPSPEWVGISPDTGLGDVLFAAGDAGSLPVVVDETPLLDRAGLARHDRLARAATRGADPVGLVRLAFRDELFADSRGETMLNEQPRMALVEGKPLRDELLWRIVETRDEEVLAEMTDGVRQQVVRDCKIIQAMELAKAAGDDLAGKISQGQDFVAAAAAGGFNTTETAPFARATPGYSSLTRPTPVQHVPMSRPVLEKFLDAVFALPYSEQVDPLSDLQAVTVLAFPRDEMVFVVELIGHEPASGEDFLAPGGGRDQMMALLTYERGELSAREWYDEENVVRRVGFTPVQRDKEASESE